MVFAVKLPAFAEIMHLLIITVIIICLSGGCLANNVDADTQVSEANCLVWGPGLEGRLAFPVRYFFIQAVDHSGQNLTDSLGEKAFEVTVVTADTQARVRVWLQVLDRHDGSYIVRFKLYESCKDIMISVLHNGNHVAQSPYLLKGHVYAEKCYCPVRSLTKWLDAMSCPASYRQIQEDLSIFDKIDMHAVAKEAVMRFNQRGAHSLCHYVVKDNKIYRKTYGEHVGFKMFMDAMLLSLTRKVVLPDLEFFVNLGDWPLVSKRVFGDNPLPIFSWCGSDESYDIVMPTYDVTESTLETMGRVSLDLLAVQANTGPKWSNKTSMAFWRGRDSRQERIDLVKLSRQYPDIIDAKLTNMFFFKHSEDMGEIVKHISFYDFFQHKYQINLDGTVAAYRFPYLMGSDSVIIKQDSSYYEHFYKDLLPYEHYIPLKPDISNLLQQIQWAKDNDALAEKIGKNAQMYMRENLLAKDIFCYHVVLFKKYAKLLVRVPEVLEDMELVEQPNDAESKCSCSRLTKKHEEL